MLFHFFQRSLPIEMLTASDKPHFQICKINHYLPLNALGLERFENQGITKSSTILNRFIPLTSSEVRYLPRQGTSSEKAITRGI